MQKTDIGYHDLTEVEKRIYEQSYVNIMTNEAAEPMTKDKVHELCIMIVDGWQYITKDSKPYNPAD